MLKDIKYVNYHKHSIYSNTSTIDSVTFPHHYMTRAKELGQTIYSTCEHGTEGNYLEAYDLCKANNLKMIYAIEAYYVDDRLEKDRSNTHIVLIAKNKEGFKDINRIISEANKTGFYYKPRIDLALLLSVNPQNIIITTACVAGRVNRGENPIELFVKPLFQHFDKNMYLEVQSHVHPLQSNHNKTMLELSNQYGIEIIHGCDSHYIHPEDNELRDILLKGKEIYYQDEEGFILDYPTSVTIFERYKEQGILSEQEVFKALNNTLIFNECEDLKFNKDIKMPSLYPHEDVNKRLRDMLQSKLKDELLQINPSRHQEYRDAIEYEMDIIEKSVIPNEDGSKSYMADYFLLNQKIIEKATKEYGGVLSKTGRGSATSFFSNKLLGFTEIDRLEAPVPLYPTRFMSTTRIVTNRSLPDIDFNLNAPEPFIKASRDLLGEDNTYWMIAYGTLQDVSAFRLVCKAKGLNISEYNDVAKELDKYRTDPKWKEYIELSTKFIGVIDSISPSPCSVLMLNEPISEQIGLMKVGDLICCNIDGYTSDVWKYLKNDFLTVTVWKIIADTYKLLGEEIPNIRQLGELLDDEVWDLYKNGHTSTLNQVDSDNATPKVMKYAPKTVAELTAFVAGIRPSFSSLLYNFLDRQPYTTGVPQVDKLLAPSFNYILYQESIMNFLVWCGLPEESTYDVIKKISKKKFTDEQLAELKEKIMKGFITNTGSLDGFDDIWKVIEDAVHYAFNSSHALAVAWDSLYGAYLKAKHPLEYFTVTSNIYNGNLAKTNKLNAEFEAFDITTSPIKFRYSKGEYFYSTDLRTIYKGVGSIKSINCNVGEQLYSIGGKDYSSFTDLLVTISNDTKCNKTQITNLILLDYFSEFGNSKQLFLIYQKFQERYKKTHIDKTKLKRIEEVLKYEEEVLSDESIYYTADNKMKSELEYLGYVETTIPNIPSDYYMVSDIITKFKNPQILLYRINNGESILYKIKAKIFDEAPFKKGDILHLTSIKQEKKWKMIDGKFVRVDEYDNFFNTWNILK